MISGNLKSLQKKDIKPSRHTTSFQRLYDVYTTSATSYRRRKDVETTSCVYWEWAFILEKSPRCGGFYERLIGITKVCLKKGMEKSRLTYDETVTFSIEAESIINSRPLTYVDDDPNNDVLTPCQLVCGRKLNDVLFIMQMLQTLADCEP